MNNIDLVRNLEKQFSVQNWTANELRIWPILRILIHAQTVTKPEKKVRLKVSLSLVQRVVKQFFSTLHLLFVKEKKRYLAFANASHRKMVDGVSTNHTIDNLFNNSRAESSDLIVFEHDLTKSMLLPECKEYRVYHSIYFLHILSKIVSNFTALRLQLPRINEVQAFVNEHSPANANVFSESMIKKATKELIAYEKLYTHIYKRKGTEFILTVPYYSIRRMGACVAANKLGIPTLEVQHGVQASGHLAYNSFYELPSEGYRLLPNIFWVWTEGEVVQMQEWVSKSNLHSLFLGGHPNFNPGLKNLSRKTKKNILFTVQPIDTSIPESLLMIVIATQDEYNWYFRFHPRQLVSGEDLSKTIEGLGLFQKVQYDKASRDPLDLVLSEMDLHITLYSSCVIEASMMEIPSIVLDKRGKTLYEHLINKGIVKFIEHPKNSDIQDLISYYQQSEIDNNKMRSLENAFSTRYTSYCA